MKAPHGRCHICGKNSKLSYEHVPPAAAFNSNKAFIMHGDQILGKDKPWDFAGVKGEQLQRGIGFYSLCSKCNNFTGAKYAPAFVEFIRQGYEVVEYKPDEVKTSQITVQFRNIYPLHIIKEIVAMFLSINPPELADVHPELRAFILNPNKEGLSTSDFAISVFLLRGPFSRLAGQSVHVSGLSDTPSSRVLSELSAPPFGFLMEFRPGRARPASDLLFFANYTYKDCRDIHLDMLVHSCYTPFPGDFREQEEVILTYINNKIKEMLRKSGQAGP